MSDQLSARERDAVERAKAWLASDSADEKDAAYGRLWASVPRTNAVRNVVADYACGYLAGSRDARRKALEDACGAMCALCLATTESTVRNDSYAGLVHSIAGELYPCTADHIRALIAADEKEPA